MIHRRGVLFVALVTFALATLTPIAQVPTAPQSTTATLSGVVTDDQNAVAPGATVLLTNKVTNEVLGPVTTNDRGAYSFAAVSPGTYVLKVTMPSFKTTEVEIRIQGGVNSTQNVKLEIGKIEQTVKITAGSEIARLDTPTVSTTFNADVIQKLPQADRNALNFLVFAPGTTTVDSAAGARFNTTIAGLPRNTFNITIDGISNSNLLQSSDGYYAQAVPRPGETYSIFTPNPFNATYDQPLSTFGADVDTASYTNVRRFLSGGQLPPREAIRLEELLNYFRFAYASPRNGDPIALTTEIGVCPWAPSHRLVLIGARAATPAPREITGRNIVLLIDVSGSMAPAERLPMIKTALGMFVDTLKPDDRLAIVTYAGTSGVALPSTPIRDRQIIHNAIANLAAGGSTNGGSGLILAYQLARQAFIRGGVNRVILATDGDFNVGVTSQPELLNLIERERGSGVFLSVLGVGSGNLKDATMEMLADRGNGNYAYLDSLQEARRVLIREGDATIEAVAKDVKFQVEFNPAVVQAWKLIGYENRALATRDFNDDRKDAGEVGPGHTVTVLYEVIPVGVDRPSDDRGDEGRPAVDALRYQPGPIATPRPAPRPAPTGAASINGEWLTVKTRYKLPDEETSRLITRPVRATPSTDHLALASAVVEFGLILRDAPYDHGRWDALAARVARLRPSEALAADVSGFRELVETARGLARLQR